MAHAAAYCIAAFFNGFAGFVGNVFSGFFGFIGYALGSLFGFVPTAVSKICVKPPLSPKAAKKRTMYNAC